MMTIIDIVTIILGSSVITSVISFFLHKKTEKITAGVKHDFENLREKLLTDLQWKQKACETTGKIYFQLFRSQNGAVRYAKIREKNKFLEEQVIKKSNEKIRDLILSEGYLIPPNLTDEANKLIEHYDVWLEKYHSMRVENDVENLHVYVGPDGYPFPPEAEELFKKHYLKLWNELYT